MPCGIATDRARGADLFLALLVADHFGSIGRLDVFVHQLLERSANLWDATSGTVLEQDDYEACGFGHETPTTS